MNWQPTCELRWVKKEQPYQEYGYLYMATVLQQKWVNPHHPDYCTTIPEPFEWRDIPVEKAP